MSSLEALIQDWVKEHPYLTEIAQLQQALTTVTEENAGQASQSDPAGGDWEQTLDELKKGIPVLRATEINDTIVENAANLLERMTEALTVASLPEKILEQSRQLQALFSEHKDLTVRVIAEVVKNNTAGKSVAGLNEVNEGFLIFLAWRALATALEPSKKEVAQLLKEHHWGRGYCPVCGHLPAMGQLVRTKKGRERELICSCCQMRWRYKRIGCPFCENDEQDTLKIIGLEEPDLRIDTCEKCKCYLKTYTSEGKEKVLLADWSTLHLDLVAEKQGFKRTGYRMYGV